MPPQVRDRFIDRAQRIRMEIEQIFRDVDHWNRIRAPHEGPIDPDPDGSLARALEQANDVEAKARGEQ